METAVTVTDRHAPRLAKMEPALVRPALAHELEAGADLIVEDAKFSIRDGAISGPGHIASLPGEPPNADTHDLDESIHRGETIETTGEVRSSAIASSDHAAFMELGDSRREPRPFMVPATERNRRTIIESLAARLRAERA